MDTDSLIPSFLEAGGSNRAINPVSSVGDKYLIKTNIYGIITMLFYLFMDERFILKGQGSAQESSDSLDDATNALMHRIGDAFQDRNEQEVEAEGVPDFLYGNLLDFIETYYQTADAVDDSQQDAEDVLRAIRVKLSGRLAEADMKKEQRDPLFEQLRGEIEQHLGQMRI